MAALVSFSAVVRSRIPEIIGVGNEKVEEAVEQTAFNIMNLAMGNSRVDTGNMRAGWQVDTWGSGSEYAARVFNNVFYTVYNEYGTIYMAAQPMLGPAVEHEQPLFEERIKKAYA